MVERFRNVRFITYSLFAPRRELGAQGILLVGLLVAAGGCSREQEAAKNEFLQEAPPVQEELSLGYPRGDNSADILVNGTDELNPVPVGMPSDVGLEELLNRLAGLEQSAQFTEAWQLARDFRAQNGDHPRVREVDEAIRRYHRLRRDAQELQFALDNLQADDMTVREIVRRQLLIGGDASSILLRKTLREESPETALVAANLLQQMHDEGAFEMILNRMVKLSETEKQVAFMNAAIPLVDLQGMDSVLVASKTLARLRHGDFVPLANALQLRIDQLPAESGVRHAAQENIRAYLTQLVEMDVDRETLEAGFDVALRMEDESLIQNYSEFGLLFLLHDAFLLGDIPQAGEYAAGSVGGGGPVIDGTKGAWSASSGSTQIRRDGLTHRLVPAAGGSLGHDRSGGGYTGVSRALDRNLGMGRDSFTLWFASLHAVSGYTNVGNRSFWEYSLGGEVLRWGIYDQELHAGGRTFGAAEAGETYLFLMKLEKNIQGVEDRWSVWVFPDDFDPGLRMGNPHAHGMNDFWHEDMAISQIRLHLQGDSRHGEIGYVDELQIAERFQDLRLHLEL